MFSFTNITSFVFICAISTSIKVKTFTKIWVIIHSHFCLFLIKPISILDFQFNFYLTLDNPLRTLPFNKHDMGKFVIFYCMVLFDVLVSTWVILNMKARLLLMFLWYRYCAAFYHVANNFLSFHQAEPWSEAMVVMAWKYIAGQFFCRIHSKYQNVSVWFLCHQAAHVENIYYKTV